MENRKTEISLKKLDVDVKIIGRELFFSKIIICALLSLINTNEDVLDELDSLLSEHAHALGLDDHLIQQMNQSLDSWKDYLHTLRQRDA